MDYDIEKQEFLPDLMIMHWSIFIPVGSIMVLEQLSNSLCTTKGTKRTPPLV